MTPSINDARAFGLRMELQGVVIVAFEPSGRWSATSWGATKADCHAMGKLVDDFADRLEHATAASPQRTEEG